MTTSIIPEGIIPPLLTPLTATQDVDVAALKSLIRKQVKAGTPALFICGTAGLGSVLTAGQYEKVIATAIETVPDGYPLLCGVLESSTIRDIERIKLVERLGIKSFVTVTPYYLRATEREDLLRHFGALRESTDMEMVLYNMPGCTGVVIAPELVFDMAKRGWSTMIKDSSGDNAYLESLCSGGKEFGLRVYQGLMPDFGWLASIGASGCVPVPSNCYPELFNSAWNERHNAARLTELQPQITEVWNRLVQGTDYISRSIRFLAKEGIGSGELMLPFVMGK